MALGFWRVHRWLLGMTLVAACTINRETITDGGPIDGGPDAECRAPRAVCGGRCVPTDTDPANCGTCGRVCPTGQLCDDGTCAVRCSGGLSECTGACHDLQSDPANCGSCGHGCSAGQVCSMGACTLTCAPGTTACGASCRDLQTD